jgi:trk system potassium uptake protein
VVDSFELNDDYSIIEAKVPADYVGKTVREVGFRREFNLLVLTIIKKVEVKSILGKTKTETQIQGVASADNNLKMIF